MKTGYLIGVIVIIVVIVVAGFLILSPTPVTSSKLRGDINKDGLVDSKDLELLAREVFPVSDEPFINDVDMCVKDLDSNGKVDMIDTVVLEMVLRPECELTLGTCEKPLYVSPEECKVIEK
jgi:hypothetical protein